MKNLKILSYSRITDDFVSLNGDLILRRSASDELNNVARHWLSEIYSKIGMEYPKFFKMDLLCKAGTMAAELVMRSLNMVNDEVKENWAVLCFNAAGSLDDDRTYQQTIQTKENFFPSPAVFVYTLANIVSGEIAIRHHLRGESSCFVLEDFSAPVISLAFEDALDTADFGLGGWIEFDKGHCDVLICAVGTGNQAELTDFSAENLNSIYQKKY